MPESLMMMGIGGGASSPWYLSGGIALANCVAAYKPKGAASLAVSYVNLANPGTYDASPGFAPTLSGNGWVFNGFSQYLKTGVVPANGWSAIIYDYAIASAVGGPAPFGGFDIGGYGMYIQASETVPSWYANQNYQTITVAHSSPESLGVAGTKAYRNGIDEGITLTAHATTWVEIYIGAANNHGSYALAISQTTVAFAIYNTILSAAQMLALHTAMAAL